MAKHSAQVTGKRSFDHGDTQQSYLERPRKRARIEGEGRLAVNSQAKVPVGQDEKLTTSEETSIKNVDHPVGESSPDIPPQNSSEVKPKSVSQHVKKFESVIQPKKLSSPTSCVKTGKRVPRS